MLKLMLFGAAILGGCGCSVVTTALLVMIFIHRIDQEEIVRLKYPDREERKEPIRKEEWALIRLLGPPGQTERGDIKKEFSILFRRLLMILLIVSISLFALVLAMGVIALV